MTTIIPHAAGTAYLEFTRAGSDTVLTRAFATSPVKVFATNAGRAACWVYAATLGGGLVGGDEIEIVAELTASTRALLTTQASTKVYRSRCPARQRVRATVGPGSLLVVAPDAIVCFAAADFTQTQQYDLRGDASLVVVDWLTSGRHATGERWAFARYENRISICRDSGVIFRDALVLEPDLDAVGERMGRFDVLLTAVMTGPLVASGADQIVQRIAHDPVAKHADVVLSASRLRDGGALLRIAGVSVEAVGRIIRDSFGFLCPLLGDDPWSRKW